MASRQGGRGLRRIPGSYEVRALVVVFIVVQLRANGCCLVCGCHGSRSQEWGGHPELVAAQEVFDRPITIFSAATFATTGFIEPLPCSVDGELPESLLIDVRPVWLRYATL